MLVKKATSSNDLSVSLRVFAFCMFTLGFSPVVTLTAAETDDYLSAITAEANKVEQGAPIGTGATTTGESAGIDESLNRFESDLKARYRGSYTFYRKLPKRSREEIFQSYIDGASIDEIRKKIMDRFLNQ